VYRHSLVNSALETQIEKGEKMKRIISKLIGIILTVVVCTSPSWGQKTSSIFKEWGFVPTYGSTVDFDMEGKRTNFSKIEIAFKNPPQVVFTIDNKGGQYFIFKTTMPETKSSAKVVFVTPKAEGAQALIPEFKPIKQESKDSTQKFVVNEFRNYGKDYNFMFTLIEGETQDLGFLGKFVMVDVVDINCFNDGSEHHIYGDVELFGIKFKNVEKEPLVFKINNGKYIYIKGKGTAKTEKGKVIKFSQ
jgi:hypothetical protein